MEVGTIVLLKTPMLGEQLHSIGVVFNKYDDGVQIIFENGGYDGFSDSEQKDFLMEKGLDEKTSTYQFKNIFQMERDYEAHTWDHAFNNRHFRKDRDF